MEKKIPDAVETREYVRNIRGYKKGNITVVFS